ncbi:sulfotransferase, partial [Synechococcus sp. AH-551-P10]|nr:sulfotransferase [Synechococcus sp. AH-551-P10]
MDGCWSAILIGQNRVPDFLGLGVQKGGTTTLHTLLAAHPQLMLPKQKELHFFTHRYWRGKRWYGRQFRAATSDQKCGEITPYYIFHPLVPERIQRCCPKARLIVLLRDPVERALSQFFHSQRLGLDVLPLEQALAVEAERLKTADKALKRGQRHKSHQEHSYVARSRYELQLQRYEQLFPREQLFVARSEDLFERPEWVWRELLQWLELDIIPLPEVGVRANAGVGEPKGLGDDVRSRIYG